MQRYRERKKYFVKIYNIPSHLRGRIQGEGREAWSPMAEWLKILSDIYYFTLQYTGYSILVAKLAPSDIKLCIRHVQYDYECFRNLCNQLHCIIQNVFLLSYFRPTFSQYLFVLCIIKASTSNKEETQFLKVPQSKFWRPGCEQ